MSKTYPCFKSCLQIYYNHDNEVAEMVKKYGMSSTNIVSYIQEKCYIHSALRFVYWFAFEEVPNNKYQSLLQFQRIRGWEDIIK